MLSVLLFVVLSQHVHPTSPAPEGTAPSSLSAEAVRQLLDGDGMGLARPAEAHHYPGPKHLLDRAKELALTSDQQKAIAAIRQQVLDEARPLGKAIVDAEHALDALFRSGAVSETELEKQVAAIARLRNDLRIVHLRAHVRTKPLLTAEQVKRYYEGAR